MKYYLAIILTLVIVIGVHFTDAQGLFNHQQPEGDDPPEPPFTGRAKGNNNLDPDGSIDVLGLNPTGQDPDPGQGQKNEGGLDNPAQQNKKMVEEPAALLVLVNKEYNLPDDYTPPDLVEPDIPFSFSEDLPKRLMRREAAEALELLFTGAAADGIQIGAVSGYRSYERQKIIFNHRARERGLEAANRTTAYPGQSEHQTGLAMDISGQSVGYGLVQGFGETEEGIWLAQNAPGFGFIVRYPRGREGETGYSYEPWHLRYVGVEAAREITDRGLILEEYVAEIMERELQIRDEFGEDLGLNPSVKG